VLEAAAPVSLLDRYVWRIVLGAFGAGVLFFLFLSVLIDLLNSLAKYVDRATAKGLGSFDLALYLGGYYLKMLPVFFTAVTPFVSVIAGMFAVARLQNANEVVPMLFAGRSIHRVLRPVLLCGVLAGVSMAACWQWIVPHVGASLAAAETFLRESEEGVDKLVYETFDGHDEERLFVEKYLPASRTMRGVQMLSEAILASEASGVSAESATWDGQRRDWRLQGGELTTRAESRPLEWLGRPDVTPDLLLQRSRDTVDPDTQSYTDLLDLVRTRPHEPALRLALHRHITFPLSCVVLLLLALPLAVHYERGSRLRRLLGAIVLCGGYTLMDLICQNLGQSGVHPVVAAWSPVIVFGALGVVLYSGTKT
jgi:lipopolysaccharide export LptBFGC system permease protein LptF